MNDLDWRNDIENAPKNKPILVIDPEWDDYEIGPNTYKIVQWEKTSDDQSTDYDWVYGYDFKFSYYKKVKNPKYWMEIPDRPEVQ